MKKKRFLFVSEPRGQEDGEQGRPGQEPTRLGRMGRPCRPSVGPAAVILQNLIASPLALAYWETDICLKPSGVRTRRLSFVSIQTSLQGQTIGISSIETSMIFFFPYQAIEIGSGSKIKIVLNDLAQGKGIGARLSSLSPISPIPRTDAFCLEEALSSLSRRPLGEQGPTQPSFLLPPPAREPAVFLLEPS